MLYIFYLIDHYTLLFLHLLPPIIKSIMIEEYFTYTSLFYQLHSLIFIIKTRFMFVCVFVGVFVCPVCIKVIGK